MSDIKLRFRDTERIRSYSSPIRRQKTESVSFEKQLESLEKFEKTHDKIVKLNIGGYKYTTTQETLTCHGQNFFSALLKGKLPIIRDEEGCIFVDRDGEYFKPILEYLRTGELVIPDNMPLKCILREAQFYCIDLYKQFTDEDMFTAHDLRRRALEEFEKKQIEFFDQHLGTIMGELLRISLEGHTAASINFTSKANTNTKHQEPTVIYLKDRSLTPALLELIALFFKSKGFGVRINHSLTDWEQSDHIIHLNWSFLNYNFENSQYNEIDYNLEHDHHIRC